MTSPVSVDILPEMARIESIDDIIAGNIDSGDIASSSDSVINLTNSSLALRGDVHINAI